MADGDGEEVRITGVVTDDATAMKSEGEVENADVNARELDDDGDTSTADGETTTNSQGRYDLAVSSRTDLMLVIATAEGFESRAVVDTRAASGGSVGAVTMTSETRGEADVFVETRRQGRTHVSIGEVASRVTADVVARMDAGAESSADVAAAIGMAEQAERAYLTTEHGLSVSALASIDLAEEAAFRVYQQTVTGSAEATVHASALDGLRAAIATSGDDPTADARARESGRAALVALVTNLDAEVKFELRRALEIETAIATSVAVESGFQAIGALDNSAVVQAGVSLRNDLAQAETTTEIDAAWEGYATVVNTHLESELALTPGTLGLAVEALALLEADMIASLALASDVDAVVSAKAAYFSGAQSSLQTALESSANAEVGARLVSLVEVH